MRASDEAKLSSRTMATTTAAVRTNLPYDASLDALYARAKERLDKAARECLAIPDAATLVPRAQRREL